MITTQLQPWAQMAPLIVDNLTVSAVSTLGQQGGKRLLAPVSLTLTRGELVGIIGESGSGKSLLAKALMGEAPPGYRLEGQVSCDQQQLALAAQDSRVLDPLRRVLQQLRRRLPAGHNDSHIAGAGLDAKLCQYFPHQLSGGMAKRVLFAQAQLQQRQWLIADEPCTGLDVKAADKLYQQLRALADDGRGVLAISHNLRQLVNVADRLVVLKSGQLVEIIRPQAIFMGQASAYTMALWHALPENSRRLNAKVA